MLLHNGHVLEKIPVASRRKDPSLIGYCSCYHQISHLLVLVCVLNTDAWGGLPAGLNGAGSVCQQLQVHAIKNEIVVLFICSLSTSEAALNRLRSA